MARKGRKKRSSRPRQRRYVTPKSKRLLSRPFYFEDRRYIRERKEIKHYKKAVLSAAIRSKEPTPTSSRGVERKYQATGQRDRMVLERRLRVCASRRLRREVLFSLRKAGKGRAVSVKRRYTRDSKVRC